ncbi:MAG: hypothetical protein WDN28_17605 [Chthoniobacter sp.]
MLFILDPRCAAMNGCSGTPSGDTLGSGVALAGKGVIAAMGAAPASAWGWPAWSPTGAERA